MESLNKSFREMVGLEPEPPPSPPERYYIHRVKWDGETLSIIAGWYTGDIENWKALAKANPELNPSRIYVGDKIRLPERLMKTRKRMPLEYLEGFLPKPKKVEAPPPEPQPPPEEAEEGEEEEELPALFGPKE
jgi:hypothetical protein